MRDYIIITDSACDLSPKMVEELGVGVIPLEFQLKGKSYFNYPDEREISTKEFYRIVREGESATTSQVTVHRYTDYFEEVLKHGRDVLYIAFSSGLSGSCNSAKVAAQELQAKYPDNRVEVVDSLCASLGQGLYVYHAVQEKKKGKSIDQVIQWLEENKLNLCHWFTVDDLNHLKRGGRVSPATAFFGTMLNIKPVLHVDDEGHLIPMGKVRGRKVSLDALVDHMAQTAINPKEQVIFISHGDSEADAKYVADQVKAKFKPKEIYINPIGPVIGAHSGPGTMALFFLGSKR